MSGDSDVERQLSLAAIDRIWPIVRICLPSLNDCNTAIAVSHVSQHLCNLENEDASTAVLGKHANLGRTHDRFCFQIPEIILMNRVRCARSPMVGVTPWAWRRLILEYHSQIAQLFRKRVPAFCRLCRCFCGGLYCLRTLIRRRLDQPEFVSGICLSPLERGDEFSMCNGWIHGRPSINQRRDYSISTLVRSKAVLNSRVAGLAISTF